jgi:putative ATP-dependent endonuclease of OLD family
MLTPDVVRKIQREVMRTRGELLFARAVVLFEGETEEQAIPMLAQHYWTQAPFQHGVAFIGVGSDGNYLPFLRILESIGIPWFIFSDGEPTAQAKVQRALQGVALSVPHPRVSFLPNNKAIEGYLMDEGYQNEIKTAVIQYYGPYENATAKAAKTAEIQAWNDENLRRFLGVKRNKTGMAPHWAKAIIDRNDARSVPTALKDLFARIDQLLIPTHPAPTP